MSRYLRVIQGLALGGELPGAIVFVYESVDKKGLALGILFTMVFAGFLLGDVMSVIFHSLFDSYAWRIAFITGSAIALIGFYIRKKLNETKMFSELEKKQKFPLRALLYHHLRNQLAAILVTVMVAFDGVIVSLYLPKYLSQHLHYSPSLYQSVIVASALLHLVIIFAASFLSDFFNYHTLYKAAALALCLLSYPAFWLMHLGGTATLIAGVLIISMIPAVTTGLFMRILCESFPTDVRFSGVALGYNIAFALVGGFAPLAAEIMIKSIDVVSGIAIVSIACGALSLIPMFSVQTNNQPRQASTVALS